MLRFLILVALATISTHPDATTAAVLVNFDGLGEEFLNLSPVLRIRRSIPQLSGEGSIDHGKIRIDGDQEVWSNDKNSLEANGFVEHNWAKGMESRTDFGVGGKINHELYRNGRNNLEGYASFNRQWADHPSNTINIGIEFHY